jgi:nitroreductase
MNVTEAIQSRRSIKKFSDRPVPRETIESLLSAIVRAPNHHLTQPWRFYVLGPSARYAYGQVIGMRKARKLDDPVAGEKLIETVASEHRALPGMIAIAMQVDENPEKREEDYAAVMMGLQNLCLAAVAAGLGTHIKTGAVMEDPSARKAARVRDGERLVAIANVGYPAEVPAPRARTAAEEFTTWVP